MSSILNSKFFVKHRANSRPCPCCALCGLSANIQSSLCFSTSCTRAHTLFCLNSCNVSISHFPGNFFSPSEPSFQYEAHISLSDLLDTPKSFRLSLKLPLYIYLDVKASWFSNTNSILGGPESPFEFSIKCYGKTHTNFLANTLLIPNRLI